jgi:hypothetical protein
MAITDFLFNGSPPPATTTYGTSTANMPQWYSDYTQGLLSKANAVASEPYTVYGGPRVADFTTDQTNAMQQTRDAQGNYMPALGAAGSMTQQASTMNPLSAGSTNLNAAAGTAANGMANWMNPATDGLVNRIGELGARNLSENLMPAIGDQFTRAGQYGSSRMQEATGNALRDTQESVLAAQNNALNNAYTSSTQNAQADATRMAQVGQTQGNLANAAQQNLLSAGQDMSKLATQTQTLGLNDINALSAMGGQQQALDQTNLNTAYGDFKEQVAYPTTQLSNMNSVVRGLSMPTSTSTSSTGPSTAGYTSSPIANVIGGLSLFNGLTSK